MPRTKPRRSSPVIPAVRAGSSEPQPPAPWAIHSWTQTSLLNPAARDALRDALTHLGQDPIDLDFMTDAEMRELFAQLQNQPRAI